MFREEREMMHVKLLKSGKESKMPPKKKRGKMPPKRVDILYKEPEIFARDEPLTYNTETKEWSSDQIGTIKGIREIYDQNGKIIVVQKPRKGERKKEIVYQPRKIYDQYGTLLTSSDFTTYQ